MAWFEIDDETGLALYCSRILIPATKAAFGITGLDLTQFSGEHCRLVLHDGTYEVWGWIGEADAAAVVGSELATNGNFKNWTGDDPDDFTVIGEDVNNYITETVAPDAMAHFVSDTTTSLQIRQAVTVEEFKTYRFQITISSYVEGDVRLRFRDETGNSNLMLQSMGWTSNGTKSGCIVAPEDCMELSVTIFRHDTLSCDYVFDNWSVKNITQLGTDAVHIYSDSDLLTQTWNGDVDDFDWNGVSALEVEQHIGFGSFQTILRRRGRR